MLQWRIGAVFFLAVCACASDLSRETILLARARYHMSQNLKLLPNYTCTQTIERTERRLGSKRIRPVDVVRLEVALVDGKELYAWPGSKKFDDRELRDLISGGTHATGQFALYAKSIFQTSSPRFTYAGETSTGGRRSLRWDFVVPQNISGQLLRVNKREAIVGYHGSFWVDPETLDLQRFEVYSDDIPPMLDLQTAFIGVDYRRTRIGEHEFLLPAVADLEMIDLRGGVSKNRTRFEGCRQYTGESTILFEDPAESAAAVSEPQVSIDIPAGLHLDLALETAVRPNSAAVGDPVTAILKRNLKLPGGGVVPKGALLHGRITMLRAYDFQRQSGWAVGLLFHDMEFEKTRARLSADLTDVPTAMGMVSMTPFSGRYRTVQPQFEAEGSILYLRAQAGALPRGMRMFWRTTELPSEDNK